MKKKIGSVLVLLCLVTLDRQVAGEQTPDWGSGVAPFGFALIGDMPYGTKGLFLLIQANPYNAPSDPVNCPSGFQAFLERLEARAKQYARPVVLAHGDDHFFFVDQPFSNLLVSRVQTYGEGLVHWVKVHVDPKSSGVFRIEQKIVRPNL